MPSHVDRRTLAATHKCQALMQGARMSALHVYLNQKLTNDSMLSQGPYGVGCKV